ncbi:MAG: flagellar hook assembly protein FlgD [Nitrospiria bacterium]
MELSGTAAIEKDPFFSGRPREGGGKADDGVRSLGKDAFLRLLTTQLQYQDPLQPMESTEFVTQLAQFSQLEQMTTVNQTLGQLVQSNSSLNNYAVAGLVGREVQVVGGTVQHITETSSPLSYRLEGDAGRVIIQVSDAAGDVVRVIEAGPQKKGVWNLSWDGRNQDGNLLPSGGYQYAVAAVDSSGAPVKSTTYSSGRVNGVTYNNGVPYLTVNGENIPAAGLVSVIN